MPKRNIFFNLCSRLRSGGGGMLTPRPGYFNPGKGKGCPMYRRLHAPQSVGGYEKSHNLPGFEPRTHWFKLSQFIIGPSDVIL